MQFFSRIDNCIEINIRFFLYYEMGGTCSMHVGSDKCVVNLTGRICLGDLDGIFTCYSGPV